MTNDQLTDRYRRSKQYKLARLQNPDFSYWVPAAEAIALVEAQKRRYSLNSKTIAEAAGMHRSVIFQIESGQRKQVAPSTMERLRNLEHLAPPFMVPRGGNDVRFKVMSAAGWSPRRYLYDFSPKKKSTHVLYTSAERVIEVVKECAYRDGPQPHAIKVAKAKGWHRAQEYDQDLLLDPLWDGAGGLLLPMSATELVEEAIFLARSGQGLTAIAESLDKDTCWVRETLRRKGIKAATLAA